MKNLFKLLIIGLALFVFTGLAPPGDLITGDQDHLITYLEQGFDQAQPEIAYQVDIAVDNEISVPVFTADLQMPLIVEAYLLQRNMESRYIINLESNYRQEFYNPWIERYPKIFYNYRPVIKNDVTVSLT